jgi:8-amino-7-oxononanoate synthase
MAVMYEPHLVQGDTDHEPPQGRTGTRYTAGILGRADRFSRGIERVLHAERNPLGVVIDQMLSPVEGIIGGRRTLLFGTNSYLGLNFHPACVQAAIDAIARSGTGSTASRVAGGNSQQHVDIESDLCGFYDRRHAIVFSTGFMANLGVISAIARRGDAIFLDAHCHASIIDACRLSGARVHLFRHNDCEHLEHLFRQAGYPGERVLVVAEGLYSVWGDTADLAGLLAVAKRRRAVTLVDEAHAVGLYGRTGRGIAESLGVEDQVDVVTGTFSKSIGVIGGYCVTDVPEFRSLRFMARPYLYTASLPPAIIASARQALAVIGADPSLREAVWRNTEHLRSGIEQLGMRLIAGTGPIGSIRMPSVRAPLACWRALLVRGLYVNVLVPPSTPDGDAVLRLSVSAAHTPADIGSALTTLQEVFQELNSAAC